VESAPQAYRLKASNVAPPISTFSGTMPRASLNNWLKRKLALTVDFNFAVQRLLARMSSCIWSRRAAR
jgi:hypothetical protein